MNIDDKHIPITQLMQRIIPLIDSGQFDDLQLTDLHECIRRGIVIRWLGERAPQSFEVGLFLTESSPWPWFESFYAEQLQDRLENNAGDESRKWLVERSVLCLLLTWTVEILQQGSGWEPMAVGRR